MSDTYPVGVRFYNEKGGTITGEKTQLRGRHKTFITTIDETATVQIQGSMGYDDWHLLTSTTFVGDTTYTNEDPWPYIRVNITANTGNVWV